MARTQGSHGEITGPKVRAAALRLFAARGYGAVSMRQIAAEVGVQAGTLYQYTKDKQSLLAELMLSHIAEIIAAWEGEPRGQTPREELESFARHHIRYHLTRPDALFIAYMELRSLSPENFARVEDERRRYETLLEDILKRGVSVGDFAPLDTKLTTMAIIAMLTGVNTWYREGGRLDQEAVETHYWTMIKRAVLAKET